MQPLSKFTDPTISQPSTQDPAVDLAMYVLAAFIGYHLVKTALILGALYVERMPVTAARQVTKLFEYGCLVAGAFFIGWAVITYQSKLYYSLDIVLVGLLIRTFIKGERMLHDQYQNAHQTSKQKAVNRLIVNLGHSVFGQDN